MGLSKSLVIYLTILFLNGFSIYSFTANAQITNVSPDYKIINLGSNGIGDYVRTLILLHEVYNGSPIAQNHAIGTITATRGSTDSYGRINIANISTFSAYQSVAGTLTDISGDGNFNAGWKLKTCLYQGKKYFAVDVPYANAFHDQGFKFSGFLKSTAESMKIVNYEHNGQPINTNLISNIVDFNSNLVSTNTIDNLYITGKVGIGVPKDLFNSMLAVKGGVHAESVKVEMGSWADNVFQKDYPLMSLAEVEKFIALNSHLPEIPSEKQILKGGLDLGEINKLLLKKIEEMTLYLIKKDKEDFRKQSQIDSLRRDIDFLMQKGR